MSTYFDQVPHELIIVILSYTENTYPFIYFKDILENNWRYLFNLKFPDLNLNYLENINYKHREFEYYLIIYKKIDWEYGSALEFIRSQRRILHKNIEFYKSMGVSESKMITGLNEGVRRFQFWHTSIQNTELYYTYFKDILTYYSNQKYGKICIEIHTTLREPTEDSVDMENFNYTLVYHDFDNNFRNTPISYKDALNIMTHVKYYSTKYHGINT